jgi:hypothetical protein
LAAGIAGVVKNAAEMAHASAVLAGNFMAAPLRVDANARWNATP